MTGVRWTGRDTLRVDWSEDWRSLDYGNLELALAEGANDRYRWSWDWESDPDDPPLDSEYSSPNVRPVVTDDGSQVGVEVSGLRPAGRYRLRMSGPWGYDGEKWISPLPSDIFRVRPPEGTSGTPAAPSNVGGRETGVDSVCLHWRDNASNETGYEVWYRKWSGEEPDEVWRRYRGQLPAGTRHVDIRKLAAEEEILVTYYYRDPEGNWVYDRAKRGRYSFVVVAVNDRGWSASETFHLEFMPGPHPEPTGSGELTNCATKRVIDLDGFQVSACLETPDGARRRAWDYQLDAEQSGLLYFFERDNAEILVKVLDGCAINGHRWVFVAPVTTLPFQLLIDEPGPYLPNRRRRWWYDSRRRPQGLIPWNEQGNPKDRTARTVSDTTAFPCTTAEIAAAKAKAAEADAGRAAFLRSRGWTGDGVVAAQQARAGASTDCEPGRAALTLAGGYKVSMCYETYAAQTGEALDYGLDSSQSALLYFFDRNNAEVLIKVLDGCGVNNHRWVFMAPVTDLAFNLVVESPSGERWTHANRLGQTADAASDVAAFPCGASA